MTMRFCRDGKWLTVRLARGVNPQDAAKKYGLKKGDFFELDGGMVQVE